MRRNRNDFNEFRFAGLNCRRKSNQYLTMDRINADETKIVIRVADAHLCETPYGYAFILDATHVVFLRPWQVSRNYFGNEVLLNRDYFVVKTWGDHLDNFSDSEDGSELTWEYRLEIAKLQHEQPVMWMEKA